MGTVAVEITAYVDVLAPKLLCSRASSSIFMYDVAIFMDDVTIFVDGITVFMDDVTIFMYDVAIFIDDVTIFVDGISILYSCIWPKPKHLVGVDRS